MTNYEQNASALDEIVKDIGINPDPGFSEADTRVKIIDRLLRDALGWPEKAISREEHVHKGYIDYVLQAGPHRLVLEAKRTGKSFTLPSTIDVGRNLTVKNLLKKQRDLLKLYDQVTRYAHERAIQYCVVTNGTQWLAFPGVRTDAIHLRQSRVLAFNGLDSISNNFLEFWNLLSYETVQAGSLETALLERVVQIEPSFVFNGEGRIHQPYDRNHLALPLTDVLPKYFGDLHGDPRDSAMLRECFVQDSVRKSMRDLGGADKELPSRTLTAATPVMHFYALPEVSTRLDGLIKAFLRDHRDNYFQVLLGRVGIGKTTFLAYFFDVHEKALADTNFVVRLDFQHATETTDLEALFRDTVWKTLTTHKLFTALVATKTLHEIFADEIGLLEHGVLAGLKSRDPAEFDDMIAKMLARKLEDRTEFVRRLATFLHRSKFGRFLFVFDNVDQLDIELQERILRFAYAKMRDYSAFCIVSMWEETYFSSKSTGRTLSTIRTVPMQITRQSITSVLVARLNYLIKQIDSRSEGLPLLDETQCERDTFSRFITLILKSLLVENRRVRTFLELVALGNIRRALEMFAAFLTAGSLETRKILDFMRHEGYRVPVHEFIKCVMLGSKRYYSERTSEILNLFAIGDVECPSHFTRLRLLQWLYERRHEASAFGSGLMQLGMASRYFSQIGVSQKDFDLSVRRLTEGGLIENDIRARRSLEKAQAIRITGAGRFYLISLHRQFAYIDLSMQDTPFFAREVFEQIAPLCESVEMPDRIQRCELFLDYLRDQEDEELLAIEKLGAETTWRRRFVPNMKSNMESTKAILHDKGFI